MKPAYSQERLDAVRIVEALRSGVPTRAATQRLPDLRPGLLALLRQDLEQLESGVVPQGRMLWGQYGQGKSHFLTLFGHHALQRGFAVSQLALSREVSCHNLFAFYRRMAPALRHPGSELPGLEGLLLKREAGELPGTPVQQPGRYEHPLPAIALESLLSAIDEDAHELYNFLVGERVPVKTIRQAAQRAGIDGLMRGLPSFKQAQASALFGVLADAVRFCGYSGWVLLIDEVELVARLGKASRLAAYRNLNWLLNWEGSLEFPIYTVCATAASLEEKWHHGTEKRPGDVQAVVQLARDKYGAAAADSCARFFARAVSEHCPKLPPLSASELARLLGQIAHLHGLAHAWEPPDVDAIVRLALDAARNKPVRTYIRAMLQALDYAKLTGALPELQADTLLEHGLAEDESFFANEE